MNEKFWYVFNPNGNKPTVRHDSYDAALREATRLSEYLGGEFFVLGAEAVVRPAPKTITVELIQYQHPPF